MYIVGWSAKIACTAMRDLLPNVRLAQSSRLRCPMCSLALFQELYDAINTTGAADHMVFLGENEPAHAGPPRPGTFRGINGLFFCLMGLRTGLPIVALSSLFGRSHQRGGAAFTTWVKFLYGALRPFVRLPEVGEVWDAEKGCSRAPSNWLQRGMGRVVMVLDATEVETTRAWLTDLAYYLWSPYKHRPTGKILIGVTPSGAICYVSGVYGGRLSDSELTQRSGVIQALEAKGFGGHKGFEVMADRGFNGIVLQLLDIGMSLATDVLPPKVRPDERSDTDEDVDMCG